MPSLILNVGAPLAGALALRELLACFHTLPALFFRRFSRFRTGLKVVINRVSKILFQRGNTFSLKTDQIGNAQHAAVKDPIFRVEFHASDIASILKDVIHKAPKAVPGSAGVSPALRAGSPRSQALKAGKG
jgi:hypothetical protein